MARKKMKFKAETTQLLDLMIHSLYSHKEIFLRELISNASDAIDKARFDAITNKDILEGDGEFRIRITADKGAGQLTISDNGAGMTQDEAVTELGTIAHSGTKEFMAALAESKETDNPELIGQFGVGFYSAFLVADRVTVTTRKAGSKDKTATRWESTADGTFTVAEVEKDGRGTDVTLHLKDDEKKYLEEWQIRELVKRYSDFIEHPIVMEVERDADSEAAEGEKVKTKEEEVLNSRKALWLKSRSEVKDEEYNEFYKHISHDLTDPLHTIHYRAEGTNEFSSLLFIPSARPVDILYREFKAGLTLYVKRVKIMEHCDKLVPAYLRFVRGVVDSSDLPLNVSREMLQNNSEVDVIRNSITKKVLDTLVDTKKNDYEKYVKFYKEFGRLLKEGVHFDHVRRETLLSLLLFPSTTTKGDELRSLDDYVEAMGEDAGEIYYITASSMEEAGNSPYLEVFRDKGIEVLIMLDEIDDMVMSGVEYKGKRMKSVIKGEVKVDETEAAEKEEAEKKLKPLIDIITSKLGDLVSGVRLSSRLKDSPCCLVTDEGAMDPQIERMLKAMGQAVPEVKKTLEINPTHPVFERMSEMAKNDPESELVGEYASLLYDQALLLEGSRPRDSAEFVNRVSRIMAGAGGK